MGRQDLREHGHDVLNVDNRHDGADHGLTLLADLADYGQAVEALAGVDAVVHLAAIPAPGIRPPAETFRINALSTYNVFAAAEAQGLRRVVWASSETVLGLPFDTPPLFAPIDETIEPRPETSYALSKLTGETMATQFVRRTGIPSSASGSRTSWSRTTTRGSPRTGTTRSSASGTCGATSTAGTSPRPAGWRSRPT